MGWAGESPHGGWDFGAQNFFCTRVNLCCVFAAHLFARRFRLRRRLRCDEIYARDKKMPARRAAGRAVGSWACVVVLFGFGEVCLDVFRLDVVEIAGAGVDGEADEAADEDVAPDPAGDGMGEGKEIYDVQFTIYNLKSSRARRARSVFTRRWEEKESSPNRAGRMGLGKCLETTALKNRRIRPFGRLRRCGSRSRPRR